LTTFLVSAKIKTREISHRKTPKGVAFGDTTGQGLEEGNQKKMSESLILNQIKKNIWSGGFLLAKFLRSF